MNDLSKRQDLGAIVSEWRRLQEGFAEAWDDLELMDGSGECGGFVARSQERETEAFLSERGFTEETLMEAVAERCNGKIAYQIL